jgi:hypothetical protein
MDHDSSFSLKGTPSLSSQTSMELLASLKTRILTY